MNNPPESAWVRVSTPVWDDLTQRLFSPEHVGMRITGVEPIPYQDDLKVWLSGPDIPAEWHGKEIEAWCTHGSNKITFKLHMRPPLHLPGCECWICKLFAPKAEPV